MVRIITDSSSDMSAAQAQQLDVGMVHMAVTFDGVPFDTRSDVDFSQFYAKLEKSKTLPTTSQPSPEEFVPFFEQAKENDDSVVVILISEQLSGAMQSAMIAKNLVQYDDIHIINSRQTIIGLRLLVEQAVQLRDAGKTACEIAQHLETIKNKVKLIAIVDTLDYLYKGGRLSKVSKIAGGMLNFKPIITLDGILAVLAKERGAAKAIARVISLIDTDKINRSIPFYVGYTGNDTLCRQLMETLSMKDTFDEVCRCPVGAVVGTHVGPNACAVAYLEK